MMRALALALALALAGCGDGAEEAHTAPGVWTLTLQLAESDCPDYAREFVPSTTAVELELPSVVCGDPLPEAVNSDSSTGCTIRVEIVQGEADTETSAGGTAIRRLICPTVQLDCASVYTFTAQPRGDIP